MRQGDVLGFYEMCERECRMLQQGMHYRSSAGHSVLLMSQRKDAQYPDKLSEDGATLWYVGHDMPGDRNQRQDQPIATTIGTPTQNGKFRDAADRYERGAPAERVRVYEKIHQGVWVFNGTFDLVGVGQKHDGNRNVWVFELRLATSEAPADEEPIERSSASPGRLIPSHVKREVYKRDRGQCAICGSKESLHFDHILPYSKGGTSTDAKNIQLLCAKHNLSKRDKIE